LIFLICRGLPKNAAFSPRPSSKPLLAAALALFVIVCLRSYIGLSADYPWKDTGLFWLVLVCAVALGKALGGFAADRFGLVRPLLVSLALAVPMLLLPDVPAAGIAGTALLNLTMPLTLGAMEKIFPNAKGFAFGLLTFALFIGFLPVYL
jgi:FSR family fosmidomycin resistance protein-like MFS transporter